MEIRIKRLRHLRQFNWYLSRDEFEIALYFFYISVQYGKGE